MALDYLRQSAVNDLDYTVAKPKAVKSKRSFWKIKKSRFFMLFGSNLIVWAVFATVFFDVNVFSMDIAHLPNKLQVTGIVYNENMPTAIISNQVYEIGEVVDGYTITDISRTEVQFEKNGHVVTHSPH